MSADIIHFAPHLAERLILEQLEKILAEGDTRSEYMRGFIAALCATYLHAFGPRDASKLDPRYVTAWHLVQFGEGLDTA